MNEASDWNDYAVEALQAAMEELRSQLQFLIEIGEEKAAVAMADLARKTTQKLISISDSHRNILKPVAETQPNWPMLRGRTPASDEGEQFIKSLNVGGAVPIGEAAFSKIPETKLIQKCAMALLTRLEHWRTKSGSEFYFYWPNNPPTEAERRAFSLPAFATNSWSESLDLAWKILLEETQQHPEKVPTLREFGIYRREHTELTSTLRPGQSFRSRESNIRDGIKERLKQAIKRLAKKTKQVS